MMENIAVHVHSCYFCALRTVDHMPLQNFIVVLAIKLFYAPRLSSCIPRCVNIVDSDFIVMHKQQKTLENVNHSFYLVPSNAALNRNVSCTCD